ncbi:MAG: DUF952 domain-containing protein [Chloroflexi bacterium]|nr:DUF952 domain-containing protein [Chloroflexota bacterium]
MREIILHICPRADWEATQAAGEYRAESLGTEGYIHCSIDEQLERVANYFFAGQSDLVVLRIAAPRVKSPVRWDPAGDMLFPHIYGPLNLDAVLEVEALNPDAQGLFHYHMPA